MTMALFKGPPAACDLAVRRDRVHPVLAYIASLESPRSRRALSTALKGVAGLVGYENALTLPWDAIDAAAATGLRAKISDRVQNRALAPATGNLWIAAIRGVLRQACLLDLASHEQVSKVNAVLRPIRGSRVRPGRALERREIRRLFAACDRLRPPARSRNLAILSVLLVGGLRRSELVGLDLDDWNLAERSLRVLGKGQKERKVLLGRQAADYVEDWVRHRGLYEGPLFFPVGLDGTIEHRRCAEQMVYDLLDRLSRWAGIDPVRPHDCRRTMVSSMLEEATDVLTVMRQTGHSSASVVSTYDLRPERAQRCVVEQLYCPPRGDRP